MKWLMDARRWSSWHGGSFYIVQVELGGKIWIRLTIINPLTSEDDLRALMKRVAVIGEEEVRRVV